jgi:hypothetical protein
MKNRSVRAKQSLIPKGSSFKQKRRFNTHFQEIKPLKHDTYKEAILFAGKRIKITWRNLCVICAFMVNKLYLCL